MSETLCNGGILYDFESDLNSGAVALTKCSILWPEFGIGRTSASTLTDLSGPGSGLCTMSVTSPDEQLEGYYSYMAAATFSTIFAIFW